MSAETAPLTEITARPQIIGPNMDGRPRIIDPAQGLYGLDEQAEDAQRKQNLEINTMARRAYRYTTDATVYANSLPEEAQLTGRLAQSLSGESMRQSFGTSGLAYGSCVIGQVIAGKHEPATLFKHGRTQGLPSKAVFEDLLARNVGGEAGTMLTTLLMDVSHGYQKQEGDGFIEVPVTPKDQAFKVPTYGRSGQVEAEFCAQSEQHFSDTIHSLNEVSVGGKVVALKKIEGNHTAITTQPLLINNVRIPVGSIVTVNKDAQGNDTFAFARLSPFNFSDPHEGVRQFPDIFNDQFSNLSSDLQYLEGGVPLPYEHALKQFNETTGRQQSNDVVDLIGDYLKIHPQANPGEAARKFAAELDAQLSDRPERRFVEAVRREQEAALRAAEASLRDDQAREQTKIDPHERTALIKKAIATRQFYYKIFGASTVKNIEQMMDFRDDLLRYAQKMS